MNYSQKIYPHVNIETLAHSERGSFKIGPFGSSLKKEELVGKGIPVLGIENILPNKLVPNFRKFITKQKFEQLSQYEIKHGDVLVTTMGTIGRAAVVPDNMGTAIIDSHLFRMRLNQSKVFPEYLCYAINGYRNLQLELRRMASGAIMAGLNTKILKICSIPLPPLPEQKRIAAILNEQIAQVEKARKATEQQLEAAKALPAAYLRSVFNSFEAQKWPRTNFGNITSDRLIGLVRSMEEQSEFNQYPYLKMNNITIDGRLDFSLITKVNATDREIKLYSLSKGDFLFNTRNSFALVGKTAVFELEGENWLFNNNIMRVRFKQGIDPAFMLMAFHSDAIVKQLEELKSKTTNVCAIYDRQLFKINVPTPSLHEQNLIATRLLNFMEKVECICQSLKEQLDTINKLPASLLRKAFNGEI